MAETATDSEWQSRTIRNWLLTILRFAVTREDTDRICALEMAREIDRRGSGTGGAPFSFFVRTSTEICNIIVADQDPKRGAALQRHFKCIDDHRLRAALEAATECRPFGPAQTKTVKSRREQLWKGLR